MVADFIHVTRILNPFKKKKPNSLHNTPSENFTNDIIALFKSANRNKLIYAI